jgi:hypothetical protein
LVPARKASNHAGDNAGGEALCALAFSDPFSTASASLHVPYARTTSWKRWQIPCLCCGWDKQEAGRRSPPTRSGEVIIIAKWFQFGFCPPVLGLMASLDPTNMHAMCLTKWTYECSFLFHISLELPQHILSHDFAFSLDWRHHL